MERNALKVRTEGAISQLREFGFKDPCKLYRDNSNLNLTIEKFSMYWSMYYFDEIFTKNLEQFIEQLKAE